MKITSVETYILEHELDKSFYFSQWQYNGRLMCIVKITTDEGVHGWGEGYGPARVVKSGIDHFKPLIIGKDPLQTEILWQSMFLSAFDYARKGVLLSAISAIDIALWDLKGKILGQSISVLLGGRKREQVRAYASGMYFSEGPNLTNRLAEEAFHYKEQGFDAMKMKVGLGVKEDIQNVKAVREKIGTDVELMIDANHAYSFKEAVQLSLAIEKYDISWFEEPISPDLYHSYHMLREKTSIPIAGGECEYLCSGFLKLFQDDCVDIVQPDICSAGGLTEVKRIASLANTFGINLVPHTWGSGIALAASLQLISNIDFSPGRLKEPEALLELDQTENPFRENFITSGFDLLNGRIKIPNGPGLGIEVEEKAIEKFRI